MFAEAAAQKAACDGLRAVTAHLTATVPFRSRACLGFRFRHVPLCSFRYRSRFRLVLYIALRSISPPIRFSMYITRVSFAESPRRTNLYSLSSALRSRAIPTPDSRISCKPRMSSCMSSSLTHRTLTYLLWARFRPGCFVLPFITL